MSAPQLLTIPEVAARLRVHRNHVYRYIAAGEFPTVNIGTGRSKTRVKADDLEAWIEGRTTAAKAAS